MAKKVKNKFRFPWRAGHQFRLLVDGDHFFPAMLNAIDQAQEFIALEMYLVESGEVMTQFIETINRAATRGVNCFLLVDDFGARKFHHSDRKILAHKNIELQLYNPFHYGELRRALFRDHRKLLVVDGRVAYVGGTGITDEFEPSISQEKSWHEVMVEIKGPCIKDWLKLFIETWPTTEPPTELPALPSSYDELETDQLGRVTVSQMTNRQEIKHSLVKHIRSAEHWIWLSTAYFVPSWKIRRALGRAAKRGIDVRLMLPGPNTDHPAVRHAGRRFYYNLLRQGVRIVEYQPRFSHAKVYLSDYWCSIGSSNVDRWNLLWNLEANQEIEDQQFVNDVKQMFENDFQQCEEITLERWRIRPWYRRFLEWFWGRMDVAIHRLSMRWRRRR